MKELIKEAENMRAKLLEVMLNIPYDFEPNYTIAITLVADFLNKLIERKDNIVDIGEVWHDIKEEPEYGNPIVYVTKLNKIGTLNRVDKNTYSWYIEKYAICKWAYVEDLLPKGGD